MLVPPELFARGIANGSRAEWRSGPTTLTARDVRDVVPVQIGPRVAPDIGERAIRPPTGDHTMVFVDAFADGANPVEEHGTRILRLAEQKMNEARSNG